MRLIEGFVVRNVTGKCVALAIGKEARKTGAMVSLNETGREIFELLSHEDLTEEQIVDRMAESYDAPYETLLADVKAFTAKLRERGMLKE